MNKHEVNYDIGNNSLYELINYNEHLVLEVMREIFVTDATLCQCVFCLEDIYALSLNSLPARYVQDVRQHDYESSNNFINNEKVKENVLKAMEKVYNNPNH